MDRETESGQMMIELIPVVVAIGAIFIFIMDRGVTVQEQLAKTRFSPSRSRSALAPKNQPTRFPRHDQDSLPFKSGASIRFPADRGQ